MTKGISAAQKVRRQNCSFCETWNISMAVVVKFRSTEKKGLQFCEYNSSVWGYFQAARFSTWGLTISRKQDAS